MKLSDGLPRADELAGLPREVAEVLPGAQRQPHRDISASPPARQGVAGSGRDDYRELRRRRLLPGAAEATTATAPSLKERAVARWIASRLRKSEPSKCVASSATAAVMGTRSRPPQQLSGPGLRLGIQPAADAHHLHQSQLAGHVREVGSGCQPAGQRCPKTGRSSATEPLHNGTGI